MDATRPHLSFPAEWIAASVLLLATLAVGSLIVSELRVRPAPSAPTADPRPSARPTVPPDAVSVPTLALREGVELAVGEPLALAEPKLAGATLAHRTTEPGPLGAREIRAYYLAGTHFILVFEPFERNGGLRIAGIYLR